jgi:hypothetical protein
MEDECRTISAIHSSFQSFDDHEIDHSDENEKEANKENVCAEADSNMSLASRQRNYSQLSIAAPAGQGDVDGLPFYLHGFTGMRSPRSELLFLCNQRRALSWSEAFPARWESREIAEIIRPKGNE